MGDGALTLEKGLADGGSPVLDQLALADFIARGELERHLRRMRLRYRERRDALVEALSRSLPELGCEALPQDVRARAAAGRVDEESLVSAAGARGVGVEGLSWHRALAGGPPGLVLGFANLSRGAIERGVAELRRALEMAV